MDLLDACKANDIDAVLALVGDNIQKSAVDLDCRVTIGHPNPPVYSRVRRKVMKENSPFHVCCQYGHIDLVNYFIKREECTFNTRDMEGFTPLHSAVAGGHLSVVKALVKEQRVPSMMSDLDDMGRTPMYVGAQKGEIECLKFLVTQTFRRKGDVEARAKDGGTALCIAARNGRLGCVELLVKRGKANVEAANHKGLRPLHLAALNGDVKVCEFIVEEGKADINARDEQNRTPFYIACQEKNFDLVKTPPSLLPAFLSSLRARQLHLPPVSEPLYARDTRQCRVSSRSRRSPAPSTASPEAW